VEAGRASLKTVSNLVSMHTEAYIGRTNVRAQVEEIDQAFAERLSVLKNLLQAGARESTVFSRPPLKLQCIPGIAHQLISRRTQSK